VPGNWHARFCSRDGGSDSLVYCNLFGRPMSQAIEFQITNHTDTTITYAVGGQVFPLPPRTTRTHQQCRPPEVTFQWPGMQEPTTVHPDQGDRYSIVRGDAGAFRVE
jgi:hypothetical protein